METQKKEGKKKMNREREERRKAGGGKKTEKEEQKIQVANLAYCPVLSSKACSPVSPVPLALVVAEGGRVGGRVDRKGECLVFDFLLRRNV